MSINHVIDKLSDGIFSENITYQWKMDAEDARYSGFPEELNKDLVGALIKNGFLELYEHQKSCFHEIQNGNNVILNTATSSGKTLSYILPIFHYNLSIAKGNALFLFPTKSLAADQLKKINSFLNLLKENNHSIYAELFDGDTPINKRTAIRNRVNLLLTNPDMLHIGILPHHTIWKQFLSRLKFVVIDEVHSYRGIFGSHFSNLIRRLKRIVEFYGAFPSYILTTATISNALEFAKRLIGEDFVLINNDSSAKSEKNYFFYNPPIINQELGLRAGMFTECVPILDLLIKNNNQTIAFARSRKSVESSIRLLKDHFAGKPVQIHGYRSGFLPKERRAIEAGLRDGSINLVVSTNAMELGIDMGKVDAVILLGYPGSITSFIQQAGRAGRENRPSVVLLMASSLPVDQFIIRHPEFVKEKSPENALINPDNEILVFNHLKCALFELPFKKGDEFGNLSWDEIKPYLDVCQIEKKAIERSGKYFWIADDYPANSVALRSIKGQPIQLFSNQENKSILLGEIDHSSSKKTVYPGAIYSHDGNTFLVKNLDLKENKAELLPYEDNYFTEPRIDSQIDIVEVHDKKDFRYYSKHLGEIEITEKVTGYSRFLWPTRELVISESLDLPGEQMITTSAWITFHDPLIETLRQKGKWKDDPNNYGRNWDAIRNLVKARDNFRCSVCGRDDNETVLHVHHIIPYKIFLSAEEANKLENLVTLCPDCHRRAENHVRIQSGLGGLTYIMMNLAPIFLMCASHDLGSYFDSSPKFGDREPTMLFYDPYPGGVGLAKAFFDLFEIILASSIDFISNCPCLDGCPSCVGPAGENGIGAKSNTLEMIRLIVQSYE